MKILVINGPNLNLLGRRDPVKYGTMKLDVINGLLKQIAIERGVVLTFFQSNHEGDIIDFLQRDSSRRAAGILINPGALVRYAWSLRQALIDLGKPIVEVHMSDINKTGIHTSVNVLEDIRADHFVGMKEQSYVSGLNRLLQILL